MTGESRARLWFGVKCNGDAFLKALCARLAKHNFRTEAKLEIKKAKRPADVAEDETESKKKAKLSEISDSSAPQTAYDIEMQKRKTMFGQGRFLEWAKEKLKYDEFEFVIDVLVGEVSTSDMAVLSPFRFIQESNRRLQIQLKDLGGEIDSTQDPASEDDVETKEETDDDKHESRELELTPARYIIQDKHDEQLAKLTVMLNLPLPRTIGVYIETSVL